MGNGRMWSSDGRGRARGVTAPTRRRPIWNFWCVFFNRVADVGERPTVFNASLASWARSLRVWSQKGEEKEMEKRGRRRGGGEEGEEKEG